MIGVIEHEPLPRAHPVEDRLEVALRRARLQALDAVAPVGHAGVGDEAGQRRVAQPRRQVVVQHRHLLGLGGEDDVAGREARRDRGGDGADVALDPRPRVVAPQHRDDHEAEHADPAPGGEPRRDEQQERRDGDREVAHRPRRGDLRGGPRQQHRADRHHADGEDRAALGREVAAAARLDERDDAAARRDHQHEPGGVAEHPVRRLHRDLLVVGPPRPRRAGVRGLEQQRRHPRQEQQRRRAEPERAVAQPRRGARRRAPGRAARARRGTSPRRGRSPSCACRARRRARRRTAPASARAGRSSTV